MSAPKSLLRTTCALALVLAAATPSMGQPTIASVSPLSPVISYVGITFTITGTGFTPSTTVLWGGLPLPTFFANSTSIGADLCPPLSTVATIAQVQAQDPGSGLSNAFAVTLNNPVPQISSTSPNFFRAGQSGQVLQVDGGIFAFNAVVRWDGQDLPTIWISRFLLQVTISTSMLAAPGSHLLTVHNPAPGGGNSAASTIQVRPPSLSSLFPSMIPILSTSSMPQVVILSGNDFLPSAQVFADGTGLSTIFLDEFTLRVSIGPALPATLLRGALAMTVVQGPVATSNTLELPVGGASNRGTLRTQPLDPAPGQGFSILTQNARPFEPFTLIVDGTNPVPLYPFPTPMTDYVLGVRPSATGGGLWLPLFDGIGLLGPPDGSQFDPNGAHTIPGLTRPPAPLNVGVTLQAIYLDATTPVGYRLTWARRIDL